MPGSSDRQKKRLVKKIFPLWPAAAGLSILILIPLAAILAFHLHPVQKEIIRQVVDRIERATRYKVEIESCRWSPFSRLYLSNVRVSTEGAKILDCKNLHIRYGLMIARPYVIVREVYLEKPFLQLERDADGKWRVPSVPAAGQGGGGSAGVDHAWKDLQPLPKIQIKSGTVEARRQGQVILSIKDVTGTLQLNRVHGPHGPEISVDFANWQSRIVSPRRE